MTEVRQGLCFLWALVVAAIITAFVALTCWSQDRWDDPSPQTVHPVPQIAGAHPGVRLETYQKEPL